MKNKDYRKGFDDALALIDEMFGNSHPHKYNISDCVKAKVNRLKKKKIRKNPNAKILPKIDNYLSFSKVNPTVDIACFNANHTYMLFGKKKNDTKLRLIGGFADVKDNGFEETAIREFKEETNCELVNVEYITSQLSNDWRFKESDDKIITTLFYGQLLDDRKLKPSDDIVHVQWVELNSLFEESLEEWIIEGHIPLVKKALDFVIKK